MSGNVNRPVAAWRLGASQARLWLAGDRAGLRVTPRGGDAVELRLEVTDRPLFAAARVRRRGRLVEVSGGGRAGVFALAVTALPGALAVEYADDLPAPTERRVRLGGLGGRGRAQATAAGLSYAAAGAAAAVRLVTAEAGTTDTADEFGVSRRFGASRQAGVALALAVAGRGRAAGRRAAAAAARALAGAAPGLWYTPKPPAGRPHA